MSNVQECTKGGIYIIWKIENFHLIPNTWSTFFSLEWPIMKSKWTFKINVASNEENEKCIRLIIEKLDDIAPFTIKGKMHALSEKCVLELVSINIGYFRQLSLNLKPLKETDWQKDGLINNDSITFRIDLWDSNINDLPAAEYLVRSTCLEQICNFQWALSGDRLWESDGKYSIDIPMKFIDFRKMKQFRMNFGLEINNGKTFVTMKVKDLETNSSWIAGKYKFNIQTLEGVYQSVLDSDWNEIVPLGTECHKHLIAKENLDDQSSEWIVNIDIIIITEAKGLVEGIFYDPSARHLGLKPELPNEEEVLSENELNQLRAYFKEAKYCDVLLDANGEMFPCHKAILSKNSSVFKTFLDNNTEEKATITIYDIDSTILNIFLNYLYFDSLDVEDFDTIVKLYMFADEYAVLKLRKICALTIKCNLSIDNACQALELAGTHKDRELEEEVTSFILNHSSEIINSSYWQYLLFSEPLLAVKMKHASFCKSA